MLFTVRNSGGRAPWTTIEHVAFRSNVVKHSAGGINILGYDSTAESQTASGIAIENNLFEDIDHRRWGGNGIFLQIGNEPANVTVDHNTVLQSGNVITVYGRSRGAFIAIPGFRFTNNVAVHNAYGIFGNGVGDRQRGDRRLLSGQRDRRQRARRRTGVALPGRELLSVGGAADGGLHRRARRATTAWRPRSAYRRAARDGTDLGVNFDELNRALAGLTIGDRIVETVLLDLVEQRLVADAEDSRGFLAVPARAVEHASIISRSAARAAVRPTSLSDGRRSATGPATARPQRGRTARAAAAAAARAAAGAGAGWAPSRLSALPPLDAPPTGARRRASVPGRPSRRSPVRE